MHEILLCLAKLITKKQAATMVEQSISIDNADLLQAKTVLFSIRTNMVISERIRNKCAMLNVKLISIDLSI